MMKFIMLTAFVFIVLTIKGQPRVFILDTNHLLELKNKIQRKDKHTIQLLGKLKNQADKLLDMKLVSVTDKKFIPVSGSKHDYMSLAPYFWYDSSKTDGLPYIRKDGQRNPEIYKITDRSYLSDLDQAVELLSLTYYLTDQEQYADKAADLLKYWFFNKDTKMNPNLEYAQAIPGRNNGRGIGIIETRSLTGIVDATGLLSSSKAWTNGDTKELQQWYSEFLNWMISSKNGQDEHKAANNHGTWYLVQATDFALFTGNKSEALKLSKEGLTKIDKQISNDGKMPLELSRTKALSYSTFNLDALFTLALLAQRSGVDLLHYKNAKGAGLQTAINWLTPFALGDKKWNYKQITNYDKTEFYRLLIIAADKYKQSEYLRRANEIKDGSKKVIDQLLYND